MYWVFIFPETLAEEDRISQAGFEDFIKRTSRLFRGLADEGGLELCYWGAKGFFFWMVTFYPMGGLQIKKGLIFPKKNVPQLGNGGKKPFFFFFFFFAIFGRDGPKKKNPPGGKGWWGRGPPAFLPPKRRGRQKGAQKDKAQNGKKGRVKGSPFPGY